MSAPSARPVSDTTDIVALVESFERADGWVDREWLQSDFGLSERKARTLLNDLLDGGLLEDHGGNRNTDVFAVSDVAWDMIYGSFPLLSREGAEAELFRIAKAAARLHDLHRGPVQVSQIYVFGDYADGEEDIDRLLVGVRIAGGEESYHTAGLRRAARRERRERGVDIDPEDTAAWLAYFREQIMTALAKETEHAELVEYSVETDLITRLPRQVVYDGLCRTVARSIDFLEHRVIERCGELRKVKNVPEARETLEDLRELVAELGRARAELPTAIAEAHMTPFQHAMKALSE